MSDMKCPFCQQELREIYCYNVVMGYLCPNPDCKKAEKLKGNAEFWQELIRTRKALDVAVKKAEALKELADIAGFGMFSAGCQDIIEQITALEQKDNK